VLTRAILIGISDELIVDAHVVMPSPLRDLIRGYNKIALGNPALPLITEKTTGEQLKQAVSQLPPEEQVELLHAYSKATQSLETPHVYAEDPKLVEQKKIRLLLSRIFVALMGVIALLLLGGVLAVAASAGMLQDMISTQVMQRSLDIVKFLFHPDLVR
jgi:hypothetical protein